MGPIQSVLEKIGNVKFGDIIVLKNEWHSVPIKSEPDNDSPQVYRLRTHSVPFKSIGNSFAFFVTRVNNWTCILTGDGVGWVSNNMILRMKDGSP